MTKKNQYLPAIMMEESNVKKNTGINVWLITGWTICIFISVFATTMIIAYGSKLGQAKSLHWLMTFIITMLQNTFVAEPLKILFLSWVLLKFHQMDFNEITNYKLKLDGYRINTKNLLQNLQLVQSIRESRRRYVYNPMTQADAEFLRNKEHEELRSERFRKDAITVLILIVTSTCCISALNSFNGPQDIMHASNINRRFIRCILQSNVISLEKLKSFLTGSLMDSLYVNEYYNGVPIINSSLIYLNNVRGWYGLYNSKVVNGGIRLIQNRIIKDNEEWKNDDGIYKEGWIKIDDINYNVTAWTYSSILLLKYFGLWFPDSEKSGFILDLNEGLLNHKQRLNAHLENGWIDNRTKNLIVEFQTYSPNTDSTTVVKIKFFSTSGLTYSIDKEVWTVPSSSMFISWHTYVFTLVFMFAYAVTGFRLLRSVSRMSSSARTEDDSSFWTVYEYALLTIVLCTAFTVAGRWRLMDLVGDWYAEARETAFVPGVTAMCQAHDHVSLLASMCISMAVFRAYRLATYQMKGPSHVDRALRASSGPVATVFAFAIIAAFGAWYGGDGGDLDGAPGLVNAVMLSRGPFYQLQKYGEQMPWSPYVITASVVLYLFYNAVVISVITKQYAVSKLYSHNGAPTVDGRPRPAVDRHPLLDRH